MTHKLCINLCCKNEEAVIERCIRSCATWADSYCIVDTGSTDRTMAIIRDVTTTLGLPGTLHERPWVNFGHNKTEAIRLAADVAEYALLMDADDVLTFSTRFAHAPPTLTMPSYMLRVEYGSLEYDRPHVVKTSLPFEYVEPVHEYLDHTQWPNGGRLPGVTYKVVGGGARSADPAAKFLRDAKLLEADLAERPNHPRSLFYLAQSYRDAGVETFELARKAQANDPQKAVELDRAATGLYQQALSTYALRANLPIGGEETFVAMLEAAKKLEHLQGLGSGTMRPGAFDPIVLAGYLRAWENRPSRAEPIYEAARYCRTHGDHLQVGYCFAAMAAKIPRPTDWLFVDTEVYRWRALDELAVAAYWTGRKKECGLICQRLLAVPRIPDADRARIKENLRLSRVK